MKRPILIFAITLLISSSSFAQYTFASSSITELNYEVRGAYSRPIKQDKLSNTKLISDVVPGYPNRWITNYVSVEIQSTTGGKAVKAVSTNSVLSKEQKNILSAVDMGSDIVVEVTYNYKNPVTNDIQKSQMHTKLTLVPKVEAEYIGGEQQMKTFLKENGINKISETIVKKFKQTVVRFTINEEGVVILAKIIKTSGDQKTDKLLLDTINKMPKWKPAENTRGTKVKQTFEFTVSGMNEAGC